MCPPIGDSRTHGGQRLSPYQRKFLGPPWGSNPAR